MALEQAHNFKTTYRDRTLSYLLRVRRDRPPGTAPAPGKIVLGVPPGVTPSGRPPVRLYVGTEPAQFRAERVFVWSIMRQRDPARVYEIHLMKDLAGFNRHNWKTGFTCYRYAIPAFAGGSGRAIYNDVDQIYLADPAALFDMEMHGKGVLGINADETSVMLIDCEKMAPIWHLAEARRGQKHKPFRAAVHQARLWGPLPGVWNARDGEYVAGASKVLHFTTLQTQPWQPFPHDLRYRPHHLADLWHGLEREADRARFTLFDRGRPSQRFAQAIDHQTAGAGGQAATARRHDQRRVAALVRESDAHTVLDFEPRHGPIETAYDAVLCTHGLAHLPADDVPWMLDELFRHARRFVYVSVPCHLVRDPAANGAGVFFNLQPPHWWRAQMVAAARRTPGVRWVLSTEASRRGRATEHTGDGGAVDQPRE